MTALPQVWDHDRCPKCLQLESVELDAPQRLCLNCRYEWDADTTTGPLDTTQRLTSADVTAPLYEPGYVDVSEQLAERMAVARAKYVGRAVVYFDAGARGVCTAIDDNGLATIEFGSGFQVEAWPDEFDLLDNEGPSDAVVRELAATDLQVATIIMRAAAETLTIEDGKPRIGLAPDGYLPDDPDVLPVVEHGAAYAVVVLALTAGITPEDLVKASDVLEEAARAAKEATER